MECIWKCILPMKKGIFDNDYYFYDDGSIMHCYDKSIKKYNIEEFILPVEITERDRQAILDKINECPDQWQDFIKNLLKI